MSEATSSSGRPDFPARGFPAAVELLKASGGFQPNPQIGCLCRYANARWDAAEMELKICPVCGAPQQWEMWQRCTCGCEFVPVPPRDPALPPGQERSVAELARIRAYRELQRQKYTNYPRLSLALLAAAMVLSAIFNPPLGACVLMLAAAFLGGVCSAYGPISKHRWLESIAFFGSVQVGVMISLVYHLKLDGQFIALLFWMAFGMMVPFWIFRRRGLALYGSSEPREADLPSAKHV